MLSAGASFIASDCFLLLSRILRLGCSGFLVIISASD